MLDNRVPCAEKYLFIRVVYPHTRLPLVCCCFADTLKGFLFSWICCAFFLCLLYVTVRVLIVLLIRCPHVSFFRGSAAQRDYRIRIHANLTLIHVVKHSERTFQNFIATITIHTDYTAQSSVTEFHAKDRVHF